MLRLLACVVFVCLLPAAAFAQPDFDRLLRELTDLDRLAAPVVAGERHVLFSSFDRASRAGRGDAAAWFANDDKGHFLREEKGKSGTEYVLAELDGRGALVRIWSGDPKGTLRIYVDGDDEPVIEESMKGLLGGEVTWCPAPLAGVRGRGSNLYLPVPFAKSLKVTSSEGGFYYHVNVAKWAEGRAVTSLTREGLKKSAATVLGAARRLKLTAGPPNLQAGEGMVSGRSLYLHATPVLTGGKGFLRGSPDQTEYILVKAAGGRPSVLTDLVITDFASNDLHAALARVMVVLAFDGKETVRVPLGAFFACGPIGGEHVGLPAGLVKAVEGWRLYSRFPMPFSREATIQIENRSQADITARLEWRVRPARGDALLVFGAAHREWTGIETRPRRDLELCDITGQGRVVGCVLTVRNPVAGWWGEGDDKITLDGEAFPTLFGTGTEDYFGAALASPNIFSHPFHGQPAHPGTHEPGLTTLVRWHLVDAIPFARSLRFEMGLSHHEKTTVDVISTVFFYGTPGTRDAKPYPADRTPTWPLK